MRGSAAALTLVFSSLLAVFPTDAEARSSIDLPWSLPQVFGVALRFVRVDRNCKIDDKDPDAAFITFECLDDTGKHTKHGAIELFATPESGRTPSQAMTRVQLTLAEEPHYIELRFLELLERKLKDERGPAPSPARPAAPPTPDAGNN